ncbi:MAG TPA: membrane dipeptidase [Terriglobales bacterium]|nr:membrane dipeptidase [Terriglobales bacterium]
MQMHRRTFLSLLGTAAVASLSSRAIDRATAEAQAAAWPGYGQAVVIDSNGDPSLYGSEDFAPLSAAVLDDVRASGLTAVSLTVSGVGSYARNYDETIRNIAYWNAQIAAHPDVFLQVFHAADIVEAKRSGRLGLIYDFQDATPLSEDLDRGDAFRNLGVRIFQLTYNRRNLVGDGCLESGNAGLSEFGRKLVARLNERRALVDVSHAGERTTLEAIDASTVPIAISHTGCAALAPYPRNKTDNELRKLAVKGGYVGIYLMPFLRSQGQPMADDLIRHLEHAIDVCGEDHVGVGTDGTISPVAVTPEFKKKFADEIIERRKLGISAPGEDPNVYTFIPDLNRVDRFARIAELLTGRKHSDARIEKILGGNFARLVHNVWEH